MELDISERVEQQLSDLPEPHTAAQVASVEELKIQTKQALLQVMLETSEALQDVERWASVQRALLPVPLRTQPLSLFCRENADLFQTLLHSDGHRDTEDEPQLM